MLGLQEQLLTQQAVCSTYITVNVMLFDSNCCLHFFPKVWQYGIRLTSKAFNNLNITFSIFQGFNLKNESKLV